MNEDDSNQKDRIITTGKNAEEKISFIHCNHLGE